MGTKMLAIHGHRIALAGFRRLLCQQRIDDPI